ncbi:hypothetical protein FHX63_001340 [Cupriavidus plantarum]|nr:hypothetical protein [Cupriavidus plantarum]REF01488.1 hypothetical protein C7418_0267 [Cupriavidus plantarum]
MTLPPSLPSASPDKVALSWLTTAAGAALFVTFQLFFYVNDFVRAHGTTTAITFPEGSPLRQPGVVSKI